MLFPFFHASHLHQRRNAFLTTVSHRGRRLSKSQCVRNQTISQSVMFYPEIFELIFSLQLLITFRQYLGSPIMCLAHPWSADRLSKSVFCWTAAMSKLVITPDMREHRCGDGLVLNVFRRYLLVSRCTYTFV